MKLNDAVAIVCDTNCLGAATAIRAVLEWMGLRVHLCHAGRWLELGPWLAGDLPPADWVVLCCHGQDDPPAISVVGCLDPKCPEADALLLHPDLIREQVRWPGRHVLALGCFHGHPDLVAAWLATGVASYTASLDAVDQDVFLLFPITLFYGLLREVDEPPRPCSLGEAAEHARQADPAEREHTRSFHHHTSSDLAATSPAAAPR